MADNDDIVYRASFNIEDILKGAIKVDKTMEDTAKNIDAAFKKAGKSISGLFIDAQGRVREANGRFSEMGNAIARTGQAGQKAGQEISKGFGSAVFQADILARFTQDLIRGFINLGQQAISTFINMTQEAVQLASSLETTGKIFEGILGEGSETAAIAALQHIREESRALGIDLAETSRAFLPFVSNLKELDRVNRLGAALAISQPEQGEVGARIALQEALSGNMASLVRRFEIPKFLGKELAEAFERGGIVEFLDKFEDVMQKMGRDIDNLTDTFQFSFMRVTQNLTQLQTAFGAPITDELKSQFDELNRIFVANFDDFEAIATKAGEIIASIVHAADVSDIGQFFADNKDEIYQFLEAIQQVVNSAKELIDLDLAKGFDVDKLTEAILKVNMIVDALTTLKDLTEETTSDSSKAGFIGGLTGALASMFPVITAVIELWNNLDKVIQGVIYTYGLFIATATAAGQVASNALSFGGDLVSPQDAFNASMKETNEALEEYKAKTKAANEAVEAAIIPVKESTKAAEELADARIALNKATDDLSSLEDDYADATKKRDEEFAKAELDNARKLEDIDIQTERKRLDIAIEFAQKREDAATDNLRKIADIREKFNDDIEDAETDHERKIEDAYLKYKRARFDQEREQAQKRVDLERDYRLKIKDIQRQFLLDADEAEEKRDAVAFIRALKDRDKKVQDAQIDRRREIEQVRISGQEKKFELDNQLAREISDADIAQERKIEDLKENLNRQLEEQRENFGEQLSDIATAESRKNEELNLWREREIEDANTAYARKLEDLQLALATELAVIEEYAAKRAEIEARIAASEARIQTSTRPSTTGGASAGFGVNPSTLSTSVSKPKPTLSLGFSSIRSGRASGGNVFAGGTYPVGERGIELFTPNQDGRIIPNSALTMPNFGSGGGMTNITNTNNRSASLGGLIDPNTLDALMASKIQNVLLNMLDKMS